MALKGEASVHVDDSLMSGGHIHLKWLIAIIEARFGECKKQVPPMDHVGLQIDRGPNGVGYKLHQERYAKCIKRIAITKDKVYTAPQRNNLGWIPCPLFSKRKFRI